MPADVSALRRWGLATLRAIFGVLALYWLWRSGSIDSRALRGLYERWGLTLLALIVLYLHVVVMSLRLSRLYAACGLRLSLADSTRLNLVSNLFNLFLPVGGGDVARIYYAVADAPGQRITIAAILFFDRVIGLVALLLCPLLLIPGSIDLVGTSAVIRSLLLFCAAGAVGITASGIVLTSRRLRSTALVSWVMARVPMRAHLASALETLRGFRDRRALVEILAISVVGHVLSGLVVVILLVATGGPFAFHPVVLLALIGFMANNVPLTPGGIGLGEAAFDSLFGIAGIQGGAAAMIGWRVLLLLLAPAGLWVFLRGRRPAGIPSAA